MSSELKCRRLRSPHDHLKASFIQRSSELTGDRNVHDLYSIKRTRTLPQPDIRMFGYTVWVVRPARSRWRLAVAGVRSGERVARNTETAVATTTVLFPTNATAS